MRVILHRSDGFYTNGDQDLKCSRRSQQGDERILDRHAACQLLFERRKGNNICNLRGLSMQNMDF